MNVKFILFDECAREKLLEFGEDDAYVQQQLPIVEDLLQQLAEKEGLENTGVASASEEQAERAENEISSIEDQGRKEAIQAQAELNRKNMEDFEEKKKW